MQMVVDSLLFINIWFRFGFSGLLIRLLGFLAFLGVPRTLGKKQGVVMSVFGNNV